MWKVTQHFPTGSIVISLKDEVDVITRVLICMENGWKVEIEPTAQSTQEVNVSGSRNTIVVSGRDIHLGRK